MSTPDVIETSVGPVPVLHRLAVGVVVRDALTSRGTADGLRVGWEAGSRLLPLGRPAWWPCLDLEPVGGGRFRLRATGPLPASLVLRLHDPARRWVSRRLQVTPWPHRDLLDTRPERQVAVASRTVPVWLAAGAAYPIPRGATTVRGRVARDAAPVAWATVVGVGAGGAVLGRTRTDDRGEFLLVLRDTQQNPVQSTVGVDLRVRGPALSGPAGPDPLAALPTEPIPRPDNPPTAGQLDNARLRGELSLPGSVPNTVPAVHLTVPVGEEMPLAADVPFAPPP